MEQKISRLLTELKSELRALYGERLTGVYLYGSYARGEADAESDVDILVVLDHIDRYGGEVERTGEVRSIFSLKYGVSISTVFVRQADWLSGSTFFLATVREDAVSA